jgi:hypothetical protein
MIMMDFRVLGSQIEYLQAAKRLEEIANALPGTPQARERKELICLFLAFEKDINNKKSKPVNENETG